MMSSKFRLCAQPRLVIGPVSASTQFASRRMALHTDEHFLSEQQESLYSLPRNFGASVIAEKLSAVLDREVDKEHVCVMRSRIGDSKGQAIVKLRADAIPNLQTVIDCFPPFVKIAPLDLHETRLFVEKCMRYLKQGEDLRRLGENAMRVVTLNGVPDTYGRADVVKMLETHAGVVVSPRDVVFQFGKYGEQKDTCHVILQSRDQVACVLAKIKELAVPRKTVYGASFGCAFVDSSTSYYFMSDSSVDYALYGSKYWVMTMGWGKTLTDKTFLPLMHELKIYPVETVKTPDFDEDCSGFIMKFERMKDVKETMNRLHHLRGKKGVPDHPLVYARPVMADVQWYGDKVHADSRKDDDGDLDEPIEY